MYCNFPIADRQKHLELNVQKTSVIVVLGLIAAFSGVWLNSAMQKDFETLSGQPYKWSDFEDKWVVVNYFAEWCAPCIKEIPQLNAFAQFAAQHEDLSLFGVSFDDLTDTELTAIQEKYEIEFDLIKSHYQHMPNQRPKSLPATFLIAPDGQVFKQLLGEQTDLQLQQKWAAAKQIYAKSSQG